MDIKNEILWRIYVVALFFIVFAMAIIFKTGYIQIAEGEKWRSKADSLYIDYRPVDADRGNIFSDDGSLLATSLPIYDIYMDCKPDGMSDQLFNKYVDTLAHCLSTLEGSAYTAGGHKKRLIQARKNNNRYLLIKKKVSYIETETIRQFPLYRLGRFKGGLITKPRSTRERPFRMLAYRTIGRMRENDKPVGLEGAFDHILAGQQGQQLMQRIAGGTWLPLNDLTEIEPKNGQDIVTTLNVNLQDITEEALYNALVHHNAKNGCAVVMEVATGKIKAIANIGPDANGKLWETYNYAIGTSTEPGSTMKLASIMALLEDGHVTPQDSIDINYGRIEFAGVTMEDASAHGLRTTTVARAFEISSNVGIARMVNKYYKKTDNEAAFIRQLKNFNLHKKTGIEIEGEAQPFIKEVGKNNWSNITLPWMSIGYETKITPLQMLTFYNGVANNGKIMKPYLVEEIQEYGKTIQKIEPTVLRKYMASPQTIQQAQQMLTNVVERGTARKIKSTHFPMAGKTGTAITNYRPNMPRNQREYQASFAGYFPANAPKYSCIVVIQHPKQNGIYGSAVAAPVFKEIAERCYAAHIDLHAPINSEPRPQTNIAQLPKIYNSHTDDLETALTTLKLPVRSRTQRNFTTPTIRRDSLELHRLPKTTGTVPDVRGMGLRDALYLLENEGLQVKTNGAGRIVTQSIRPGTIARGQKVILELKF